jgi:transketolase
MLMEKLNTPQDLHDNPTHSPLFSETIQNKAGESIDLASPKATRALVALMDMQAVIGGAASHFGGPAAFAEMMSACHGYFFHESQKSGKQWHEMFHFINDAGHCENGLYALKANYGVAGLNLESLKGFRSIESGLTGHGEAHLFPEGVFISNGPLGSGLPQAQGLAAAESMSDSPRVTVTAISDGACMEGEAKEAFAAIPGLASKGQMGPFVCMISDNNTKLSGRIDDDSFSMKPTFDSLSDLGWEVAFVEDGHDLQGAYHAIETAMDKAQRDSKKPQLLWFKTIKGKGVAATEASASGGHGFPLSKAEELQAFVDEIYGDQTTPEVLTQWATELTQLQKPISPFKKVAGDRTKIQTGVSAALIEMYENNYPVVSVSADLQGSTGVAGFRKKYPEASFEVGVAESNMVSMAVGLSKAGYIPVVDTFAQFGVTKGALPLIMSGLSQAPLVAIYSHTGFQDAADGASHQALTYFAMMSAIPNVDVICLTCADEAHSLITQALKNFAEIRIKGEVPRSTVFFLGRETYPSSFAAEATYTYGKAQVVKDQTQGFDQSVTLMAAGSLLENALIAQVELAKKSVGSIVLNPSIINQPDLVTLKTCLDKTQGRLVTIEDHRAVGGMGAIASHALMSDGVNCRMRSLGIQDHFGRSAYTSDQLYEKYGLGVGAIVEAAQSTL